MAWETRPVEPVDSPDQEYRVRIGSGKDGEGILLSIYGCSQVEAQARLNAIVEALNDVALANAVHQRTTFALVDAVKGLLPIVEGVRHSLGLGKTQLARVEAAKNAIAAYDKPCP